MMSAAPGPAHPPHCACGAPARGGVRYCADCGAFYGSRHRRWPVTLAGSLVAWAAAAALVGFVWSQPGTPLWASAIGRVATVQGAPVASDVGPPGSPGSAGSGGASAPRGLRLVPAGVDASSYMHRRHERHPPGDAFDGVQRTAWNDGVEGSGAGQWIEARMGAARRFRRVRFSTGFDHVSSRYGDLFYANAHMSVARIEVDGRAVARVQVEFDRRQAVVDLDATGTSLRIVAESVYAGQRWQDVCVSEVEIEGE
jgi:hypothetical protein